MITRRIATRAALSAAALAASCHSATPNAASRAEVGIDREVAAPAAAVPSDHPAPTPPPPAAIRLPLGERGIGFDDLGFARARRKLLVPGGGTGKLDFIDPDSFEVTSSSVGTATPYGGGHDDGVTSADSDGTNVFGTDRTSRRLVVVDPSTGAVKTSIRLSGHPDYVRWVGATKELWVAEPNEERIEVFALADGTTLKTAGEIRIMGGPESLVVDEGGKRAFTHLWDGITLAIDLGTRSILAKWPNGCRGSRGIAYDSDAGIVLAACAEGKLVALDANHDGRQLGSIRTASGVDVIAFNASLRHAYVPAAEGANMMVVGLSKTGEMRNLHLFPTARGAHCVAADDRAHAWVCDPTHGQVLLFTDSFR